jgi:alkylated DNA repair dioxygenase AlkB
VTPSTQPRLFPAIERPALPDADVVYWPTAFAMPTAERLLREVETTTAWRQETIQMYGKAVPIPRLSAWYGDPGCAYSYSGIDMTPAPWTSALAAIKSHVERVAVADFNSVLCNLYRDGDDSVAWHADDEPELGPRPVIASVSLGATRTFCLRHRDDPERRWQIDLEHGSLLVMQGSTQRHWLHQLPKTTRRVGRRINLTFRVIHPMAKPQGAVGSNTSVDR